MAAKKALSWVLFWICAAVCFNLGIYIIMGKKEALEFLGGYVIELSLSVDNLFLFIMIFTNFGIAYEYQRRILNYGVAGAIILRMIFVILGTAIVKLFHWILYLFGIILIMSGIRMALQEEENNDFKNSKLIRLIGKAMPITDRLYGDRFFIKKGKVYYATPLLAIVILIEFTDVMFAIDSIPAIFSITTNAFIVYTSNIFAILGLRSMYFVLGKLQEKFKYVKYGVAIILTFTGVKLFVLMFDIHITVECSLIIILAVLSCSIAASVLYTRRLPSVNS